MTGWVLLCGFKSAWACEKTGPALAGMLIFASAAPEAKMAGSVEGFFSLDFFVTFFIKEKSNRPLRL